MGIPALPDSSTGLKLVDSDGGLTPAFCVEEREMSISGYVLYYVEQGNLIWLFEVEPQGTFDYDFTVSPAIHMSNLSAEQLNSLKPGEPVTLQIHLDKKHKQWVADSLESKISVTPG